MNSKFFDLKKNKQDKMINAALKVFAENGYRHAGTDDIVKLAEISKGLLFHYFISKMGLYEFLLDYSIKYVTMELNTGINREETDYFLICKEIESVKFHVMQQFPHMIFFLKSVFEEEYEEVKNSEELEGKRQNLIKIFEEIYKQADYSKYGEQLDVVKLQKMVNYILDGSLAAEAKQNCLLPEKVYQENAAYLDMLQEMVSIYSSCK